MLEVGKFYSLKVVKMVDFGVYLAESETSEQKVLLPKKEVPEDVNKDDTVYVFIYRDSDDRLIATTKTPLIDMDHLAALKVKDVSKIGAFLDWGLDKDLLLPYKEQIRTVHVGDKFLVALYPDKSDRLCATMKINKYLSEDSPYKKDDKVKGTIININPEMGAYVAVDNKYYGMLNKNEIHEKLETGSEIEARVASVRSDGKLNLSLREKAYIQMDSDVLIIKKVMEEFGGELPFDDKADPATIEKYFKMSKNAFKRAIGRMMKNGIVLKEDGRLIYVEKK